MKKYICLVMVSVLVLACGKAEEPEKAKAPAAPDKTSQSEAFIAKGVEALNQQDIVDAIQNFDNAIKVDPQNPDNYMLLGQVYLRLRNYAKAVDTFNAGTRVDPDNGEMYYFLGAANAVRSNESEGEMAEQYRQEGIIAAKRSVEIFVQQKDEEKFKRALALLKSLQENGDIGKVPEQASN